MRCFAKVLKQIFSVLLFVATTMLSVSCNKDDNSYEKQMIGTWVGVEVKTNSGWVDITSSYYSQYQFSITFHEDGTYYGTGYFGTGDGVWSIEDNTIITYVDGEEYYRYDIYSLSGNEAHVRMYSMREASSLEVKVRKR